MSRLASTSMPSRRTRLEQKYNLNLTARAEAIRYRSFEAIVNERYDFFDKDKIKENPNGFLERIETIPTDKEHLSQDEVIRLASTESRHSYVYTTDLKNQYQSLCDIAILFISFSNSSKRINTGPKYFSGTLYVVAAKYRIVMQCSLHSLCFNSSLCF